MPLIDNTAGSGFAGQVEPKPIDYGLPEVPGVAIVDAAKEVLDVNPDGSIIQQEDPSFGDILKAELQTNNTVGSLLASEEIGLRDADFDPDFDIGAAIKDTPYASVPERFIHARNQEHFDAIVRDIEREERNRETLAKAGTGEWVASMLLGQVLDPVNLIGLGAGTAVRLGAKVVGSQLITRGISIGIGAAADATIQEAILQGSQQTRTAEESAYNIGGSLVMGSLMGYGLSRILSPTETSRMSKAFEDVIEVPASPADDVVFGTGGLSAAGAQAVETGAKPAIQLEGAVGTERALGFQDPVLRTLRSQFTSAREAGAQLFETVLGVTRNQDGFTTAPTGGSVETRIKTQHYSRLGEAVSELDRLFMEYRFDKPNVRFGKIRAAISRDPRMSFKQFKEEVGRAMSRNDEHPVPQVAAAAKAVRARLFTPTAEEAVRLGILPEEVLGRGAGGDGTFAKKLADEIWDDGNQSYVTRIYNREKIAARYGEFKTIIGDYLANAQGRAAAVLDRLRMQAKGVGEEARAAEKALNDLLVFTSLSREELNDSAAKIIDNIMGHPDGRMLYDLPEAVRGPLKARTLRIRDELIEPFLERDIENIARIYTRTVGPDIELTRMFGSPEMQSAFSRINEEYAAKASAAGIDEKTSARLSKARDAAIRDLEAVRDRLRGTYGLPANPMGMLPRTARAVRTLNYLRLLGGMTVSAIPDAARTIMVHGVTSTLKDGFVPLIKNLKGVRLAAEEVKLAGTALDLVLDTRAMAIADVLDDFGRYSKFERALKGMQDQFGVISLMAPWNAGMKQFAGMVTMTNIVRASQAIAKGASDPAMIRKLAASGISPDVAQVIAKQFAKHGAIERGVFLPNTRAWDLTEPGVREALDSFRGAVARDVDRIVVTPGQDKPLWMSTELGKIIGQFKSFGIASIQRTLIAGLQERDAGVLVGSTMMIGLGVLTTYLKYSLSGRELPKSPEDWAINAIDYSGLTGWMFEVNHFAERATGGVVSINSMIRAAGGGATKTPSYRYAARNWADAVFGPTGGMVKDAFAVSSAAFQAAAGEDRVSETDIRALRRMLPLQNVFYLSWLFRSMEQGAGAAVNAKPSGSR